MNILQYELFVSVAQTHNISRTAEIFFISQPAVSHHIRCLEESLGVGLLQRFRRGVVLTDAGEELLPLAREIVEINSRAVNRMHSIAEGKHSRLQLAVLSSSTRIVSRCMSIFSEENPDIQVDISLLDGEDMVNALRINSYDIYFALQKMSPVDSEYEEMQISRIRLSLFINSEAAAQMGRCIDWDVIKKYPLISVPRTDISLYSKVSRICKRHGYDPQIRNTYNRAEASILSVSAGMGVAILPDPLGDLYNWANVVTLDIDDPEAVQIISCIWDRKKVTDAGRKFLETVRCAYDLK